MVVLFNLFFVLFASAIPAISCFSTTSSIASHSSKPLLHQHHPTTTNNNNNNNKRSTTSTQLHLNFLETLFSPSPSTTSSNTKSQIISLKQQLFTLCSTHYGKSTPSIRSSIESLITQLQPLNPTPSTSTSSLLQRKWIVLWTSEKEINFFLDRGISTQIEQTLTNGQVLENWIPFVKGGGFGVTGTIRPATTTTTSNNDGSSNDDTAGTSGNNIRTEFEFKSAKLDLNKWGTYNFPPIGSGWFDTIYLDEELRIDWNSRNDILICRGE
jgi:hypothetical protein